MRKTAIIVAGGTGIRVHAQMPKQFTPIGGIPMLAYSIRTFHRYNPEMEIIVSLNPDYMDKWNEISREIHIQDIPVKTINGGKERFYSVSNALNAIANATGLVAIHDAARPFVSEFLIENLFNHAEKVGSAIPALPLKDSIRGNVRNEWVVADRSHFRTIQTPQVFDLEKLKLSYQQPFQPKFTDDATVYESSGNKVYLIDGEENNFKITTEKDLGYAEWLASLKNNSLRM